MSKDVLRVIFFTSGILVYLLCSDKSSWREIILLLIALVYACGCIHNSQFFRNVDKMAISAFFTGCSIYIYAILEILLGPLTFPKSNWLAGAFLLVTFALYFMLKKVKFQLDDLHLVAISISYIFLLISSILSDLMKYTKVVSVFAALLAVLFHFLIEDGLPAIKQRIDIKNKKLDTSYELTETWQNSLKMVDLFNINVATAYSLMPMLKDIHGIHIFLNNILLITMFIVAIEFLVEGLLYMLCEHVFQQHIDLLDKMVEQKKNSD